MRFNGLMLLASAVVLSACGGDAPDTTQQPAGGTAGTPAATATATAAPITGQTHVVRMVLEGSDYKYVPERITIKPGDGVTWVMVSGAPHNVAFEANRIPANSQPQLSANMPNQLMPLSSPMMSTPNEEYTVSFANLPAGEYHYNCTPHLQMNMRGVVVVEQ
jgi:plastocyanin